MSRQQNSWDRDEEKRRCQQLAGLRLCSLEGLGISWRALEQRIRPLCSHKLSARQPPAQNMRPLPVKTASSPLYCICISRTGSSNQSRAVTCHRALGNSHVWPLREDSACIVDPPTDAIIHGLVGQSAHLLVSAELASQSESTRIRVEHCLLQASMQHMPKFQARATLALQKCSVRLFASGLFKVQ